MKEYVVYIMYSERCNKIYKGETTNLIARFKDHNELGTKGWARKYRPWKVIEVEFYDTKSQALTREKYLKSGAGRDWIKRSFNL